MLGPIVADVVDAADAVDSEDAVVFAAVPFDSVHSDGYCLHRECSSPNYAAASFDDC